MRSGIRAIDIGDKKLKTVKASDKLVTACKRMSKHRIGGLPVVSKEQLVGIITERDIISKACSKGKDIRKLKVKDIMTSPVKIHADKHEDLTDIAKKMVKHDVSRIPILDDKKLVGFITNKDLARESPALINVLLEQIKMNDPAFKFDPRSFGSCETCGEPSALDFKSGKFLCELCVTSEK